MDGSCHDTGWKPQPHNQTRACMLYEMKLYHTSTSMLTQAVFASNREAVNLGEGQFGTWRRLLELMRITTTNNK